jgi:hypothetical protein
MNMRTSLYAVVLASTGCVSVASLDHGPEPTRFKYTEPERSGLVAGRPFPSPEDVCQVIGENPLTSNLLDDSAILIGCPKHERGAIADRITDGGRVVAHAKHWTLLSMPLR